MKPPWQTEKGLGALLLAQIPSSLGCKIEWSPYPDGDGNYWHVNLSGIDSMAHAWGHGRTLEQAIENAQVHASRLPDSRVREHWR